MKFEILFYHLQMNILGKDICYYLLQFVDTKDISSLSKVNKFFNTLIKRKYSHVNSWKKVKKKIGKGDYYALILAQKYREFSLNDCLYAACRGGSLELVKEMLKRGADDLCNGFYKACKGGHKEIFYFIAKKEKLYRNKESIYWNYGIEGACLGGNENIIKKILCYSINYNHFIKGIFLGNNIEFLKYIPRYIPIRYWNRALYYAAYNNSLSLINLALKKGAIDMQEALNGACCGNHLNLITHLISNYSYKLNLDRALHHACTKGHKNIIDYIMYNYKCNVNHGLAGACYGGKLGTIEYMVSKGASDWDLALVASCRGRKLHIVKMICEEKIEYLTKENVESFISSVFINKEIKKYLKSVLEKIKE